jgi:WD40 repeat protein
VRNMTGAEPAIQSWTAHQDDVYALTCVAIQKQLIVASAGPDHTVRLWDPRIGEQTGPPLIDEENVFHAVAVGSAGSVTFLAAGGPKGRLFVYRLPTGSAWSPPLHDIDLGAAITSVVADGATVAACTEHGIVVLRVEHREKEARPSSQ